MLKGSIFQHSLFIALALVALASHTYFFYTTSNDSYLQKKELFLENEAHKIALEFSELIENRVENRELNDLITKNRITQRTKELNLWQYSIYQKSEGVWIRIASSEFDEMFANGTKDEIGKFIKSDEEIERRFYNIKETFDTTYTLIQKISLNSHTLYILVQKKERDSGLNNRLKEIVVANSIWAGVFAFIYFLTLLIQYKKEKKSTKRFKDSLDIVLKSKKRDNFIKDNIGSGVMVINSSFVINYANSYICSKLECSSDDVLGENFFIYLDSYYYQPIRELLSSSNIEKESIKLKIVNRLGKTLHFTLKSSLYYDKKRDANYYILIFIDNTESVVLRNELTRLNQSLERKIKEKIRYTRGILDSQNTLIFVCSKSRILDANRAFLDFFGGHKSVDEFLRAKIDIFALFEKDDEDGYVYNFEHKDLMAFLLVNKSIKYKVKIRLNKRVYIFNISADFFEYREDFEELGSEHFIVTLTDITEFEMFRKEEINLAKLTSIGKLTAGITHEINTPLTYMKGNLELTKLDIDDVKDESVKKSLKDGVATLEEGIRRLEMIVKSMQEFVGSKGVKREKTELFSTILVSLRMLYNKAKHLTQIYINNKPFSISMENLGEEIDILAIPQKLEQVWIVIINNALDEFMKNEIDFEKRYLKIDVVCLDSKVVVSFEDNAGGVNETIIDKIFDPLISTKTSSGMGLGLNIAKKIIEEEHQGTIYAKNLKEGALFCVEIPISKL